MAPGATYIGTSGYVYPHWRGRFYPADLPQSRWLEFYVQQFPTVELNVTFYRLSDDAAFRGWYDRSPATFRYAVKGSRYITHVKRLHDVTDAVRLFFKRAQLLREKLAVVLWQLPPTFRVDLDRLERFVELLGTHPRTRHVLEVRHPSWVIDDVRARLRKASVALCQSDWKDCPVGDEEPTADFVYIRRHGADAKYHERYQRGDLERDAAAVRAHLRRGHDAFVYFNNDAHGYAVMNALELTQMVKDA